MRTALTGTKHVQVRKSSSDNLWNLTFLLAVLFMNTCDNRFMSIIYIKLHLIVLGNINLQNIYREKLQTSQSVVSFLILCRQWDGGVVIKQ